MRTEEIVAAVVELIDGWVSVADELDRERGDSWDIEHEAEADVLRSVAADVTVLFERAGVFDTESSVSRQHYIDTGRYLTWQEVQDL
jgi:hypothetical protein